MEEHFDFLYNLMLRSCGKGHVLLHVSGVHGEGVDS